MNPNYLALLASRGITPQVPRVPLVNKVQPLVNTAPIQPQVAIRTQGFGTHFQDTPPEFMDTGKTDNKIERLRKPKPKKTKKKKRKR